MTLFKPDETLRLDEESGVPLYLQVEQELSGRISDSGEPNGLMPSEEALMKIFGVSRITIRRAVAGLVEKGLLERKRGVGTRIIRTQIVEDLGKLRSYTQEVEYEGFQVVSQVLDVTVGPPSDPAREALDLAPGQQTVHIKRLRGTNIVFPVVLFRSEIPTSTGMTEQEDFNKSTYELLDRKYNMPVLWAEQKITAANATEEEAELLRIEYKAAVLTFTRIGYSVGDRPVEYVRGVFNPEHYAFSVRLSS